MILTMTQRQFEKRWYIIKNWIPLEQRKAVTKFFNNNKGKIDETTHLEITVQRG